MYAIPAKTNGGCALITAITPAMAMSGTYERRWPRLTSLKLRNLKVVIIKNAGTSIPERSVMLQLHQPQETEKQTPLPQAHRPLPGLAFPQNSAYLPFPSEY